MIRDDRDFQWNRIIFIWYCWKSLEKRIDTISKYKMINFDNVSNENETGHNSNWSHIPDHP